MPREYQEGHVDLEDLMRTITDTIRNELRPIDERLARGEQRTGSEPSVRNARERRPQVPQR